MINIVGGGGGGDGDGSVVSRLERDAGPQGTERTVSHMGKEFLHLRKDSVFLHAWLNEYQVI